MMLTKGPGTMADDRMTDMERVARASRHVGHDPSDSRTQLVEDLAGLICDYCGHGDLRWRDPDDKAMFYHNEEFGYSAVDCEASHVLRAAVELGVPIYTGADLEISPVD